MLWSYYSYPLFLEGSESLREVTEATGLMGVELVFKANAARQYSLYFLHYCLSIGLTSFFIGIYNSLL